jgi:aspartate/methionine/tyrosine aminotransferase
MFSSRVPADLRPNPLALAVREARAQGQPLIDLTVTNPTVVGIHYPESILAPLSSADARHYEPQPFGLRCAREAVALDYDRRGIRADPDCIVLTASTSDAYSLLFKLLCEPEGDAVLVPVPSYPLFDHLTRLDGVRPVPYPLEYHGRWSVDFDRLDAAWTKNVRATLAVSPNNPTGSVLSTDELGALARRCADRDAALILDEVFADYPMGDEHVVRRPALRRPALLGPAEAAPARPAEPDHPLLFRLGGLSKSAGLPQVKLGWIAVEGRHTAVDRALERLELICDTYLSVSTPVQVAAPELIAAGAAVRAAIVERVRENYGALRAMAARHPAARVLETEAGWSVVLRVPATRPEEELVLTLLRQDHVLVHPGFFFDFHSEAFLVVSLLPEPAAFREGVRRILERVDD